MPRRSRIKSLEQTCLENIAQNIDQHWRVDSTLDEMHPEKFRLGTLPLDNIHSICRMDLLKILIETENVEKSHLHLLLDEHHLKLDLFFARGIANSTQTMRMLFNKCQRLKRLKMVHFGAVAAEVFCALPTNLTHLDVTGTEFSDTACTFLAENCPQLQELGLFSTPVTDQGMTNLCSSSPDGLKKCTKLRKLDVEQTRVTIEGVKVVLQNVPGIHYLIHHALHEAVAGLHDDYTEGQIIPPEHQYQLRKMDLIHPKASNFNWIIHLEEDEEQLSELTDEVVLMVLTIVAYCPCLTSIKASFSTDEIWPTLHSVKGLESLDVGADKIVTEFSPSIVPILQISGETIRSIHLDCVSSVDVGVIGALCPMLENFAVSILSQMPIVHDYPDQFCKGTLPDVISSGEAYRFKHLSTLEILCEEDCFDGSLEFSEILLYSKNLKHIRFLHADSFCDETLEQILRVNPLKQLETLMLYCCPSISGPAVSRLLLMENNLRSMNIGKCDDIFEEDYDDMLKIVKQEKLDVGIAWSDEELPGFYVPRLDD